MKEQQSHIRFGIMCNGYHFPVWQAQTIQHLLAKKDVELALLIFNSSSSVPKNDKQNISLLWRLYDKFYVQKKAKALKLKDLSQDLQRISSINCTISILENGSEIFDKIDVETIKKHQLDFILKFGFGELEGAVLEAAKNGVWTYDHSDLGNFKSDIPGFWEIYKEDLVTGAFLRRLNKNPGHEIILKKGFLKTELFFAKNIDNILFESTKWPAQLCVDIRNNQIDNLITTTTLAIQKKYAFPTNFELIKFFFTQLKIFFKKAYKTLFITDYWNVGVAMAPIQAFLDPENLPEVKWFPNLPKNKFIADPFGIYYKDRMHIIYEDYLFHERIGTTASLEFTNESFKDNGIVISEKFHMSYPFVFTHKEEIYCIPETYQANHVRLYKAVAFPKKWVLEKVLIENYAGIDNTLLAHDGNWWLFSTDKFNGHSYNLNIFYAKDIFGIWKPHPKNPVKTDVRSARPAGTIFQNNGNLFRPSMDYSEKVEGRIVINKIIKLTKTDFKEEENCTINPYSNTYFSDKIHTLSEIGPYTIIDSAKELFVLSNIHALKYKLISLWGKLKKS